MNGQLSKKLTAGALALLMLGSALPAGSSFSGLFGATAITASAEQTQYDDETTTYHADTHTLVLAGSVTSGAVQTALADAGDEMINVVVSSKDTFINGYSLFNVGNNDKIISVDFTSEGELTFSTSFQSMFYGCSNLQSVNFGEIDTSSVTNMRDMFYGCSSLKSLDLSSFNTKNVTNMKGLFNGCSSLKKVYVSTLWNTNKVTIAGNRSNVFTGCELLIGGNGTTYVSEKADITYAQIDKQDQPGYLTGVYSLELPDEMVIAVDAASSSKVGNRYIKGARVSISGKLAEIFDNVKANGQTIENKGGQYVIEFGDEDVKVTVNEVDDPFGTRLYGHSISLDGDIGVNFYMELDDNVASSETAYMEFSVPNGSIKETQIVYVNAQTDESLPYASVKTYEGKKYYAFKCKVTAKDMTSVITAQMKDGDNKGAVYKYSVREYAAYVIEHPEEFEDNVSVVNLVKSMLDFGSFAQKYFNNNIEDKDLANYGLDTVKDEVSSVSADEIESDDAEEELPEGLEFEGSTLSLKSETTLSFYFKNPGDIDFSVALSDQNPSGLSIEIDKTSYDGYTIVRVRGICAIDLDETITLNISVDGDTSEYYVSNAALSYCRTAISSTTTSEELKNVCRSLYLYWYYAREFF